MSRYLIAVQQMIDAPAQTLFNIVANPAMHPAIDESGSAVDARGDLPARLCLGARFAMDMRLGGSYRVTNRVVEVCRGVAVLPGVTSTGTSGGICSTRFPVAGPR